MYSHYSEQRSNEKIRPLFISGYELFGSLESEKNNNYIISFNSYIIIWNYMRMNFYDVVIKGNLTMSFQPIWMNSWVIATLKDPNQSSIIFNAIGLCWVEEDNFMKKKMALMKEEYLVILIGLDSFNLWDFWKNVKTPNYFQKIVDSMISLINNFPFVWTMLAPTRKFWSF